MVGFYGVNQLTHSVRPAMFKNLVPWIHASDILEGEVGTLLARAGGFAATYTDLQLKMGLT